MILIRGKNITFTSALIESDALISGTVTMDLWEPTTGTKVLDGQAMTEIDTGASIYSYTLAASSLPNPKDFYMAIYKYDGSPKTVEYVQLVNDRERANELIGYITRTNNTSTMSANQFTMTRGEEREMFITICNSENDRAAFDMSGRSDIIARFNAENSTYINLKESLGEIVVDNETAGILTINIDEDTSNNLRLGSRQDFSIHIEYATAGPRIAKFRGRLNVLNPIGC